MKIPRYPAAAVARRVPEAPKTLRPQEAPRDERSPFVRDRARVLHSAALRRLADKTQVVGPRDGDTQRTRLTHSLEVGQISRGIGAGLGLDRDLCELAGLCHDIGHPPYGHNGEDALRELCAAAGGFEGNAQTLRILTRLEPKVLVGDESYGLNLTRAALDAATKYPRLRTNPDGSINRKYGAYDEDAEILAWVRAEHAEGLGLGCVPPLEGQVMDISDDIAYSVHDVEDGIVAGRIDLRVLWDLVELSAIAKRGAQIYGCDPDSLVEAAARLRGMEIVAAVADYDGSLRATVALKKMTSEFVGRFVGGVLGANQHLSVAQRLTGRLVIPPAVKAEVMILKTLAILYVMDDPGHLRRQDRQREQIARVYDFLQFTGPELLDPIFQEWYLAAQSDQAATRVLVDQIASLTESRLQRLDEKIRGTSVALA